MADGRIEIDTKINTDEAEKDAGKLSSTLKGLVSGSTLKNIGKLSAVFAGVSAAVKTTKKVIDETSQAYRVQAKAEKQLEAAAKNNPYLDSTSVKQLKDFAGEMQKISTVGDESLIPMMSQLAAAGRTQAEIQGIVQAAIDVSATGMMSLDSAIQSLNASYSGNVGLLGRQISELKSLTTEELKSGKAVEIVQEKFKGVSKEVTAATGSSEQLKNAWGDLKEEIGAPFEKTMSPMRQFFTELISGWTDARKKRREYQEAVEANDTGKSTVQTLQTELDGETKRLDEMLASYAKARVLLNKSDQDLKKTAEYTNFTTYSDSANPLQDFKEQQQAIIDNYTTQQNKVTDLNNRLTELKETEKAQAEAAEQAAAAAASQAEKDEINQKALKFMQDNQSALDTQIEQIKLEASLKGEEADQQEILNAMIQSYIDLVTGSDLVTENNPFSKKRLEELQNYAESIPVEQYKELKEALEEISNDSGKSVVENLQDQIANLDKLAEGLDQNTDLYKEYAEKRKALDKEITEEQNKSFAEQCSNLNNYVSKFSEITSSMTDLIRSSNEAQTDEELTELSKQYTDGLISYEEYCEKKEKIDKDAAQREYKLKMWEWTSSLLTATANVAQGISSALTTGSMAQKIINAALVGTAGAVQIASIMANKPTAPSFATGGIVQGSSYSGDNVKANVNSGEMILNAAQQRSLWNMANGGNGGGTVVNMPVSIQNNASSEVSASAKMTSEGLRVTIDRLVSSSMQQGRYNNAMTIAENKKSGVSVL